jgi:hypothetical protein
MSATDILAPPTLDPPSSTPEREAWERERAAFYRLLPSLLNSRHGKYVAIHNEQPVESGDDTVAVATRVYQRFGYIPVFIGHVTDQPQIPIRIPTPRRASY